ncbi:MAG TPA: peptidylprolyl isomerase [Candidatus Azoamicus sp.]
MKIKIINNVLLIFLSIILINTANSNYIKNEKIIFQINDKIELKSKINAYCDIVKLFSNKEKINKINLKNKIIKELALINTYNNLIKDDIIILTKESLESIYKDSAEKKYISITHFKKLIKKKYKIRSKYIKEFIINNLALNKIQKTIISEELILSDKEILNFFNIANYKNYAKNLYDVKVIEVSFLRKRKKHNFKIIKNLINNLEKESEIEQIKLKLDQTLLNLTCKIIELNNPKNKIYYFLRFYLDKNFKKNIIGPFFMDNYIYIYKIIEKRNKTENYKSYIKVSYHTLQKKKLCEKKNTLTFLHLNQNFKKNNIEKIIKTKEKICWLDKDETDPTLYDKIKNLKINEISEIIETQTGWYVIKILDKIFDQKSSIYGYIVQNIMIEKIKLLTQQFEDKMIKNIDIRYYTN